MTDRQFPVHRLSDAALDELTDLLADLAAEDLLRKAAAASPAATEPKRGQPAIARGPRRPTTATQLLTQRCVAKKPVNKVPSSRMNTA